MLFSFFFFSSRRRHTRCSHDWSSDVCSSDLSTLFSPTCVGEVRREHPFHLATLRAVRKATNKPVKISYTGIQVLAAATTNQYYKETRELALAIAKAFNEDFKELADNGVDIIQLDEFVWP